MFDQRETGWKIAPGVNFVPLVDEFYCFPDYTLIHVLGRKISMELFHPWHANHFTIRLQKLAEIDNPPLILGVSKVLLKDPLVAQSIKSSELFLSFRICLQTNARNS